MIHLHLIPIAGLANRLRAYASAAWIAEEMNCRLVLDWRVGPQSHWDCGARFHELFANEVETDTGGLANLPVLEMNDTEVIAAEALESLTADHVVRIRTCYELSLSRGGAPYAGGAARMKKFLSGLRPISEIAERIAGLSGIIGDQGIGVHVRAGRDVEFSRAPRDLQPMFFEGLDALRDRLPHARFYVASDSRETIADFIVRYGARVVTANGIAAPVARRSVWDAESVREALVDLMMLGRCRRILGTFYSSFSDVAAQLGGVPIFTLPIREADRLSAG